jgi:hypothetical protein
MGLLLYEMFARTYAYCLRGTASPVPGWEVLVEMGVPPTDLEPLLPDTPPAVSAVINACLRHRPEDRMTPAQAYVALQVRVLGTRIYFTLSHK